MIWQIASTTGWTKHYILWREPYATLLLMTADAPRMVDGPEPKAKRSTAEIFQSMLNAQK